MNDLQENVWSGVMSTTYCLGGSSPVHGILTLCFAYPCHDLIVNSTRMKFSSGIGGGRRSGVTKSYVAETTFLLKLLYCILLRESVDLPPKMTAITWHPRSSITSVG